MPKTGKKTRKRNSFTLLLVVFIAVAALTIILLEYIDFKKGSKSFIFSRIFHLENTPQKVQKFNEEFTRYLNTNKIPYDYFLDKDEKYHVKMDIRQERFDILVSRVKTIVGYLEGKIELIEFQGLGDRSILLYNVILDQKATHLLLITKLRETSTYRKSQPQPTEIPQKQEAPPSKTIEKKQEEPSPTGETGDITPRIAFIIDDLGAYEIGPLELKKLNIPITASVLPDSRRAHEVVYWIQEYDLRAIIHLPMQPTNSNGKHYDPKEVITVNSTDDEIRALINRAQQIVPIAKGINNHEGSLVTANGPLMKRVLSVIKEKNLFFIDSRTIGNSVAYHTARSMGVKTTRKDIFIDHLQTYEHSMSQIRKMVDIAIQNGQAIAIGHPFDSTIQAIHDSLHYIKSKGVKIVWVSDLLE